MAGNRPSSARSQTFFEQLRAPDTEGDDSLPFNGCGGLDTSRHMKLSTSANPLGPPRPAITWSHVDNASKRPARSPVNKPGGLQADKLPPREAINTQSAKGSNRKDHIATEASIYEPDPPTPKERLVSREYPIPTMANDKMITTPTRKAVAPHRKVADTGKVGSMSKDTADMGMNASIAMSEAIKVPCSETVSHGDNSFAGTVDTAGKADDRRIRTEGHDNVSSGATLSNAKHSVPVFKPRPAPHPFTPMVHTLQPGVPFMPMLHVPQPEAPFMPMGHAFQQHIPFMPMAQNFAPEVPFVPMTQNLQPETPFVPVAQHYKPEFLAFGPRADTSCYVTAAKPSTETSDAVSENTPQNSSRIPIRRSDVDDEKLDSADNAHSENKVSPQSTAIKPHTTSSKAVDLPKMKQHRSTADESHDINYGGQIHADTPEVVPSTGPGPIVAQLLRDVEDLKNERKLTTIILSSYAEQFKHLEKTIELLQKQLDEARTTNPEHHSKSLEDQPFTIRMKLPNEKIIPVTVISRMLLSEVLSRIRGELGSFKGTISFSHGGKKLKPHMSLQELKIGHGSTIEVLQQSLV